MEAKNIFSKTANPAGWHRNTDLCMDVKTLLRIDSRTKQGKGYPGVLTRDTCEHYTFVESLSWSTRRNPRLFNGRFISITRQDDGSLRPNFKPMKVDKDFSVDGYAIGVCDELREALKGLVEEV